MAKMAAEADALGLVLSDKEVFQLKGLGDSITKGTKLFGALTQHISAQLAPVLDGVLKLFTGWTKEMGGAKTMRSDEHTSELPSLMRISYAVFCLTKTKKQSVY